MGNECCSPAQLFEGQTINPQFYQGDIQPNESQNKSHNSRQMNKKVEVPGSYSFVDSDSYVISKPSIEKFAANMGQRHIAHHNGLNQAQKRIANQNWPCKKPQKQQLESSKSEILNISQILSLQSQYQLYSQVRPLKLSDLKPSSSKISTNPEQQHEKGKVPQLPTYMQSDVEIDLGLTYKSENLCFNEK